MRSWLDSLKARLNGTRSSGKPPNVLWICADDYAPYVSGTYGNPLARTPNLDRLAAQGLRFDRAYCNCPLSTPSRMAFLTGRYPRSVGVTLTPSPLPKDEITIGRLLKTAGYETLALGKTHYYDPLIREFDQCADLDLHETWLASRSPDLIPPSVTMLGPWRPFHDPASVWLNSAALPYATDAEMPDTFFTDLAGRFLGKDRPVPFFLWTGFYVTHSPFRFPVEFRGRFDPSSFTPPAVDPQDEPGVPGVFWNLSDDQKRGIIASYYTSVEYMDRNVGRILDALDRSPYADNTLVIFNSDHGYLLGQHGRFEKHCSYEEAVRSALILRMPGVIEPGGSTDALVELIDLVPTILQLCGVQRPSNLQGRSLVPLLSGNTRRHRDHVIVEYADNAEAMIRTDRWKLVYSAGNRRRRDGYATDEPPGRSIRLYDLANDPQEVTDVMDRNGNASVVKDLLDRLAHHIRTTEREPGRLAGLSTVDEVLDLGLPPTSSWR